MLDELLRAQERYARSRPDHGMEVAWENLNHHRAKMERRLDLLSTFVKELIPVVKWEHPFFYEDRKAVQALLGELRELEESYTGEKAGPQ